MADDYEPTLGGRRRRSVEEDEDEGTGRPAPPPPSPACAEFGPGATIEPPAERYRLSASAPQKVRARSDFAVDVTVYARSLDPLEARRLAGVDLGQPVRATISPLMAARHGAKIRVDLVCESETQVMRQSREMIWDGTPEACQFDLTADNGEALVIRLNAYCDEIPVGRALFTLEISGRDAEIPSDRLGRHLSVYQRAFVSYSSEDRDRVKLIAAALEAAGIEPFLDVMSLRSGEAYEERLQSAIREADLFVLCWSKTAQASEWVRRELRWASKAARTSEARRPDINPIALDLPLDDDQLPPELAGLHISTRFAEHRI